MCVFDVFNCKYCLCRLYILHVVQPADITLQVKINKSAAQFLTVNSGRRFFNRTPSVLLSSTSERPSTAKTTQHPDPSIDPQVDQSHPSPHPSFPILFQRPHVPIQILIRKWTKLTSLPVPPVSPMVLTMIYPKQAYFIDCP